MQRLNLTLPTPAENVALDEALLDWAEEGSADREVLRVWESPRAAGRCGPILARRAGNQHRLLQRASHTHRAAFQRRRGDRRRPGLLDVRGRPQLRSAAGTTRHQSRARVRPRPAGNSDQRLWHRSGTRRNQRPRARRPQKFSGNSLRAKRSHFLYHGTLLYNFDLSLIASCLLTPPRQPDYREARDHLDFVMNVPLTRQQLTEALDVAWPTTSELFDIPMAP